MAPTIGNIVFYADDPDRLSRFWAGVFGYPHITWDGSLKQAMLDAGLSEDELSHRGLAEDPEHNGPRFFFHHADGPKQGRNRMHIDVQTVAVAASNNPILTTLVAAVSGKLNPDVNLVDTLNGGEFTVFAPVDSAFAKIDPATIDTLKTDSALLTSILTYHVVPGQIEPADIAGTHTTVQGGDLTVTGSGDSLMVNGAMVVCGGVQTANAVVYLVDTVLMPPMG